MNSNSVLKQLVAPILVIAFAILLTAGFMYGLRQLAGTQPALAPTGTSLPAVNLQIHQIDTIILSKLRELGLTGEDVKLYRNEELGFEFLYPIIDEDNNVEIRTSLDLRTPSRNYKFFLQYCNLINCNNPQIRFFAEETKVETIQNLSENYFIGNWKENLVSQTIISTSGLDALQSSFKTTQNTNDSVTKENYTSYVQFIRNKTLYTFYSTNSNELYQKVFILSFKFL
jgi:hypothetical protein